VAGRACNRASTPPSSCVRALAHRRVQRSGAWHPPACTRAAMAAAVAAAALALCALAGSHTAGRSSSPPALSFMDVYYSYRNTSSMRWVDSVPLPLGLRGTAAVPVDWNERGAVTKPTSQGRCATCQDFSCVADIEGAWHIGGHPLTKLSEQEMIDCGGGNQYGMRWVQANGGIASGCAAGPVGHTGPIGACQAPLANHSDRNLTGCRGVTNCTEVKPLHAAYINGTTCLTNHNESNILALLQHGPMSVSVNAGPFNGCERGWPAAVHAWRVRALSTLKPAWPLHADHGGIINCSGSGIDHGE
jgi:hypothetical protein